MENRYEAMVIIVFMLMEACEGQMAFRPTTGRVLEGNQYTFTCEAKDTQTVQFRRKSETVCILNNGVDTQIKSGYSCHVSKDDNSRFMMTIASVNRTDASKEWFCQFDAQRSNNATLSVLFKPAINSFTANSATQELIVDKNEDILLSCSAEGNPVPDITLSKNGDRLEGDTGLSTIETFKKSAECDDIGMYKCAASNTAGVATERIRLLVRCKPRANLQGSPIFTAPQGGEATLQASVVAYPVANFTWYGPSGDYITDDVESLTGEYFMTSQIVIDEVNEDSLGDYVVIVQNSLGRTNITLILELQELSSAQIGTAIAVGCIVIVLLVLVFIIVVVKKLRQGKQGSEVKYLTDLTDQTSSYPSDLYAVVHKPDKNSAVEDIDDQGPKVGRDQDGLMYARVEVNETTGNDVTRKPSEPPTTYACIVHNEDQRPEET